MGFSKKAKQYFQNELGLTNKEIAVIMDNYNESLVSRYMKSDIISNTFINKIKKYFPDADIAYLINDEIEETNINKVILDKRERGKKLVEEIELRLHELKSILARV